MPRVYGDIYCNVLPRQKAAGIFPPVTSRRVCRVKFNPTPALAFVSLVSATSVAAQDHSGPKFMADVPASIQTPDTVGTRIGTLKFSDGLPDQETVQKVYDNIDFSRGVGSVSIRNASRVCLRTVPGPGGRRAAKKQGIGITENLMDARSLFLTANTTTVYVFFCVDLTNGPVVAQVPPGVLGPVDDAYFRYVTDVGLIGPDRGKGGKYLFVPPGYSGELPSEGYFVTKSPTNTNLVLYRAFVKDGDIAAAVRSVKDHARVYRLSAGKGPPETTFINISGKQMNTVHANDFHFYEELNSVIQAEPGDAFDPEIVGLFASIGIKKGKPFAPDTRMKAILTEAVAVGNATARSMVFAPRDERAKFYPDRQWNNGFIGNSYQFLNDGERMLDARTMFHYAATGITPAMADAKPGTGSAYAFAVRD